MEAWEVVNSRLVAEGIVKDVCKRSSTLLSFDLIMTRQILYGLPVATNKIADLSDL